MDEWELRRELIDRQAIRVFGQGACTLIRKRALDAGVSFAPVPGNTGAGLMQGEDRHFCIRAEQLHLDMIADGWPDIFHIYHRPEDEALIPEMLGRLQREEWSPVSGTHVSPVLGDLVSLELYTLEPVQAQMYAPTQHVRGRIGQVVLHPELEQALLSMERGETRIVRVHFGLDYPFAPYRGKAKLIRLTLIDHKPFGFPPVIEDEVFQNDIGERPLVPAGGGDSPETLPLVAGVGLLRVRAPGRDPEWDGLLRGTGDGRRLRCHRVETMIWYYDASDAWRSPMMAPACWRFPPCKVCR
jgi:hypothetical protein